MKLRGINVTTILAIAGIVIIIGLVGTFVTHQYWNLAWIILLVLWCGTFLHTIMVGHLKIWERLVGRLAMPKDAQVLDMSAGRINDLLLVAKSMTAPGKVYGMGPWKKAGQAAKEKVSAAKVADRLKLVEGNVFNMDFPDRHFDYVLVDLAFHNISPAIERGRAIQEAGRVMKADGQLVIVDFEHIAEYQQMLANLGFNDIRVVNAGINGWWGGPWAATKIVIAKRI